MVTQNDNSARRVEKMLNKSKGNMYPWVTHTWNPIRGKCPHDCSYCYMKRYPQPDLHLDEKSLRDDMGQGNFIFVGSSCDMWASDIPSEHIATILRKCNIGGNRFLFQSKNPGRFHDFVFLPDTILGTTIETNRTCGDPSKVPLPYVRMICLRDIPSYYQRMVSIEPIMDFDLDVMVDWIAQIKPDFVSIGADSGNNHLPEPSWGKVQEFIKELSQFTEVRIKDNLKRLGKAGVTGYSPWTVGYPWPAR